jgi:P-type E1-E2 ATPase
MGGAEEICTDKTGTLTTGKMEVDKVYVNGKTYSAKDVPKIITSA